MSSLRPEQERRICGVLCISFSALMLVLLLLEMTLDAQTGRYTLTMDFADKARMSYVGSFFLIYMLLGGLGFVGSLGIVAQYGRHDSIVTQAVRLSGVVFFVLSYWIWGTMFIVQHQITWRTTRPTDPEEWVLHAFDAADAFFALSSWGRLGPAIIFYSGLAVMLWRSVRLLARTAAGCFVGIAALHLVQLAYITLRGVPYDTATRFADKFFFLGDIVGFVLAGAALISEKGVFVRSQRL